MNCNVCKEDKIYGIVYNDKKICKECERDGYIFSDNGNIIKPIGKKGNHGTQGG